MQLSIINFIDAFLVSLIFRFEQISHIVLFFPLLTLNDEMLAGTYG